MSTEICRWATGSDRSQRQRQVTSHSAAASFSHHGCHVDPFSAGQLRLRQGSHSRATLSLACSERANNRFDCGFGRPPSKGPANTCFVWVVSPSQASCQLPISQSLDAANARDFRHIPQDIPLSNPSLARSCCRAVSHQSMPGRHISGCTKEAAQRRHPRLGKHQSEIMPPIYRLMLTCRGDNSRCLPHLKCRFDVDAGADASGYTLANLGW